MINFVLAISVGIITIVSVAAAVIRDRELRTKAKLNAMRAREISLFLDMWDDTRETRYNDRSRMLAQFDGWRHDWYAYEDAYAPNFSMD